MSLSPKGACESLRLSPCVLVQPDEWARGEREGYGGPRDVTSLSLSKAKHASRIPTVRRLRGNNSSAFR